jgi:hypothetical protein
MKRYKVAWQAHKNYPNSKGGQVLGPTRGQAVPRNGRQGCLCLDTNNYSRECCKGLLINQGIGQTQSAPIKRFGSFNNDFNNDFDIFQ